MRAEELTLGQWWLVNLAVVVLFVAAFHFCFRNGKATAFSLIAPALGAVSAAGASAGRGDGGREALVIYFAAMLSLALLLVALRPEITRMLRLALAGENYEPTKWRIYAYTSLTLVLAVGITFYLL
ncbi:hypothetical protein [Streptomyces avicenniae]|uniref:hypothetical protein n=1 Tax=Streptomyces avicenniae TaxID=500153 RepID=UPI00069C1D3A|nr:hypothetical protein [Streptomyces avicenniae]